jgi:hypothetical protein
MWRASTICDYIRNKVAISRNVQITHLEAKDFLQKGMSEVNSRWFSHQISNARPIVGCWRFL